MSNLFNITFIVSLTKASSYKKNIYFHKMT